MRSAKRVCTSFFIFILRWRMTRVGLMPCEYHSYPTKRHVYYLVALFSYTHRAHLFINVINKVFVHTYARWTFANETLRHGFLRILRCHGLPVQRSTDVRSIKGMGVYPVKRITLLRGRVWNSALFWSDSLR